MEVLTIFEDSRYGGPHSQFINLVKILKAKVKFKIFISNQESKIFEKNLNEISTDYKKEKIDFLSISKLNFIKYAKSFFTNLFLLVAIIKENKSNYLYIPGGSSCIKSVIAGIICKKKIIWHIHDAHSNILLKLLYFIFSPFIFRIIFASKKSFAIYFPVNLYLFTT